MLDNIEIKKWLDSYEIKNYTIKEDKSVDVEGDVKIRSFLSNEKLYRIPVKFGVVSGNFDCAFNQLTSLENAPHTVVKRFDCSNQKLTSLEGCPKSVGGGFLCHKNLLTSLEHSPEHIKGSFDCSNNKITNYECLPSKIEGFFSSDNNPLTHEEYLAQEQLKKDIEDEKTALRQKVMCEKKVKAVSKFKI